VPIPYARQTVSERDVAAVSLVLRSDWLTQGPTVDAFEEAVASASEVPHAVAFSSGTAALHGAAFAAGVRPGTEVVTSGLTFAASANCAAYLGGVPRFADIEDDTWNLDPESAADACGEATAAVVPVDFAGLPADVAALKERIPDGVTVIRDASHSLGAIDRGTPVGSCREADMTVFSFHPVKAVTAGEGGIVTTRDEGLRDALREFRNHGFTKDPGRLERDEGGWYYEQQTLGFNYRLSDIHCALGLSQLERLEEFIERRNAVAARYREQLEDVEGIELPPAAPKGSRHAYHLFVIRCRGGAEVRRRLYDGLREAGIFAQVHYIPVYWHPWYRETYGYEPGQCERVEHYYAGCLSLPCFPGLTDREQDRVVEVVREALSP